MAVCRNAMAAQLGSAEYLHRFIQEFNDGGHFIHLLGDWLSASVARAGFDADQDRRSPRLRVLHSGRVFETVPRNNAIVMIRRQYQHGWIFNTFTDIVEW